MLQIKNVSTLGGPQKIFTDISFDINEGEQIAIVGPSGSGKTSLLRILSGQMAYKGKVLTTPENITIAFVEQQHRFKNLSNISTFYYQQRFNASDAEDALTVKEYIDAECKAYQQSMENVAVQNLLQKLHVIELLDRRLIQLSNGENKRVQIAKTLLSQPDVLLLDNPYLGLDAEARVVLTGILESLKREGMTIIMTSSLQSVPSFITHVLHINGADSIKKLNRHEFRVHLERREAEISIDKKLLEKLLRIEERETFASIIRMKDVTVSYHGKEILKHINWHVSPGDRWALSGPNGAGKSTLLSLINADNPQAYANEIYLFDKRKGRSESIWDIKKRIGYVSPELHLFFEPASTVFNVVASGLFDTIGLFRVLNEDQVDQVNDWLRLLKISQYAQRLLSHLPLGIQRLALLARALIKNPPLLLLDEPAQGLDNEQALLFKNVIEQICDHSNKTLIYVSHYKEEIPASVTKFIHLEDGMISFIQY